MAVKQEIAFNIGPDGSVEIEVKGVKGADCVELTRELEEALGIVKNRVYTSEYYQEEQSVTQKVTVGEDE